MHRAPAPQSTLSRARPLMLAGGVVLLLLLALPMLKSDDKSSVADVKAANTPPQEFDLESLLLKPWGYNANRNVPRWRAILRELYDDVHIRRRLPEDFTLLDFGADEGYFSVSAAKAFPKSKVMAVELGGVGGSIHRKKDEKDVHAEQERAIAQQGVGSRINLCQTLVKPEYFAALREAKQAHTVQFVLSMLHWFQMPTRADFERVVVDLFSNAQTTIIEMPTIGDDSQDIKNQYGYEYWKRWYDGRTDVKEILEAAIKSQGMTATVKEVATLPWGKYTRVVYRVDVAQISPTESYSERRFDCEAHRRALQCGKREKYQDCSVFEN